MGGAPAVAGREEARAGLRALSRAGAQGRPVSLAGQRLLPVDPVLAGLLPDGGLRRGSTLSIGGTGGGTSLVFALTSAASRAGSWMAAVGLPELGVVAAAQMGLDLGRFALVPSVGEQWPVVAAALLDGVDVLLLGLSGLPGPVRPVDARRLVARARERGVVLLVLSSLPAMTSASLGRGSRRGAPAWPEPAEVCLHVDGVGWAGLGRGHGHLQARMVDVTTSGRRAAAQLRRNRLWLPGPDGRPAVAEAALVGTAPAAVVGS